MTRHLLPNWQDWDWEDGDEGGDWLDDLQGERESLSENGLSLEQQWTMRQVAEEAQTMSREELICALLDCWEQRFGEKMAFAEAAHSLGIPVKTSGPEFARRPRSREDFTEIFGYEPTPQQALAFLEQMEETATMELNMERVVDSVE